MDTQETENYEIMNFFLHNCCIPDPQKSRIWNQNIMHILNKKGSMIHH